jgi:O-succinylbenzoate synthase
MKTLSRKIKKDNDGNVVITSTIEASINIEQLSQREEVLTVNRERTLDSLKRIDEELQEIKEIRMAISKG